MLWHGEVPPSGGSLEIGNVQITRLRMEELLRSSPFGGIPRNWKPSLISRTPAAANSSPFGGIPRNWKLWKVPVLNIAEANVPPSGGSLEIGNYIRRSSYPRVYTEVPPSGGSLEIGNVRHCTILDIGI